ncbi:MAG: DNA-processing protein DprA [Gammaproteobacteria bacterium]|nr:DNA-processing protein DprA [Gammaproteobacteria bacterium]MBQ0840905.1 DNA-processing protein DprA [Gammaproteobacteria bacterium]
MTERECALILQALPGIGSVALSKLHQQFGSFAKALQAPINALAPAYRKGLNTYRARPDDFKNLADKTLDTCLNDTIDIVLISSPDYPPLLREIDTPPALLFVKGSTAILNLPQIAIVGSRNHSTSGQQNAKAFARHLAGSGFVITSGLALGIDGAAHQGALETGNTVAVLGTGVDVIYPRSHQTLYKAIIAGGGAIVSEFPPGTPARPGNFPQRNRIISGLSLGVLVVEAAMKSGSLITARLAMEQGREVFAIPSSIHNPCAKGCHQLIRQGAALVETSDDIINELGGLLAYKTAGVEQMAVSNSTSALDETSEKILDALGFDPADLDTLITRTQLSPATLSAVLVQLELEGWVEQGAGIYSRLR